MASSYDKTADPFYGMPRDNDDPAMDTVLVTPSDGANLSAYAKSFRVYVPTTIAEATVKVTPLNALDDANTVTLKYQPGVTYEPLAVRKIWATGTTAGIEIHAHTR